MYVLISFILLSTNILLANGAIPGTPPDPLPSYLYQVLTDAPPSPLPDVLPMSDRDAADGFVHLIRAINMLPLVMKNYNYTVQIWALRLDFYWMRKNGYEVKWEWSRSNTTVYPHLYANITKKMVLDQKTWTRKPGELWNATTIVDDPWLTDSSVRLGGQMTWIVPLVFICFYSFVHF
ncbi:unnamed protein product [Adineta ricciae]|uniref:Uncharacterized protein n=1 Tax=Adineta ricciae TaxID=249248 RepID=A0A814WLP4_ADIRI|nr:unnamed protein product [Adineta ricciae]CAF1335483.1 unnamed protein product [Adineta ricciae]